MNIDDQENLEPIFTNSSRTENLNQSVDDDQREEDDSSHEHNQTN